MKVLISFLKFLKQSLAKINPEADPEDINRLLEEITLLLDNEDLGKAFYEKLTEKSGLN